MLHNIQGNNLDYLGAALETTCDTLYAEDVFLSEFVHLVRFVNDVTNTVNVPDVAK
jgi:hypothetical protein